MLRVELIHALAAFGDLASAISKSGGDIISIDVIRSGKESSVRDITVQAEEATEKKVIQSIQCMEGIRLINISDRTFLVHLGGKISIQPSLPINEPMKLAAARAIASVVSEQELNEQYIIPSIFNEQVVSRVRRSVIAAAILTGTARLIPPDFR